MEHKAQFNTPRLAAGAPEQATQYASKRGKQLDAAALETIKRMRASGADNSEVAEALDKLGYVSILGLKLTGSLVSNFALKYGLRLRETRRRSQEEIRNSTPAQVAPARAVTTPQDADAAVAAVMAWQGISKDQKRRIVAILLED